jgi:hypothetical protein
MEQHGQPASQPATATTHHTLYLAAMASHLL